MKKYSAKQILLLVVVSVLIIAGCVALGNYYSQRRGGFKMGNNRLIIHTERQGEILLFSVHKNSLSSNAYIGTVDIAISPNIPADTQVPQDFELPIVYEQIVFSNAKNEVFYIEVPYWRYEYLVLIQAGSEQALRRIKHNVSL